MQQKMMMFMPIMMTGMFLWAASGLVHLLDRQQRLGHRQQMITNRLIGPASSGRCGRRRAPDEERQERRRRARRPGGEGQGARVMNVQEKVGGLVRTC
jgi:membrane protein insertase Oxa1/YidC/SpoIIIJ